MSVSPSPQLQYKIALVKLQQQRAMRISLWRACFMISLAMGLGLIVTLPNSQIKARNQIKINGDTLVSEDKIHQALDFDYPQFIWSVNGIKLAHKIESIPSIKAAKVNKQIIPPTITIALQEKIPVALATSQGEVGFLTAQGEWIEQKFYDNVTADFPLPKLKVIDYRIQFQQPWHNIYQLISLYPEIGITEVHWQSSGGVSLKTHIGQVFLGSQSSRFDEQFKIISKLKNLPEQIESDEIAYIDLSNPGVNLIQRY